MPYIYEVDVPTIELAAEYHPADLVNEHDGMLHGFDYIAETDLTASNVFTPENVGVIELTQVLAATIHAAQEMDNFKKALFRKRSREESNLGPFVPGEVTLLQVLSRLDHPDDHPYDDLFHGIIGAITEVGELAEILMALLDMETVPDQTNVREEIGDVLRYLSRLVKYSETTFPAEMRRNIAKLRQRHGQGGFNKEADITRDLDAEHKVLGRESIAVSFEKDGTPVVRAEDVEMTEAEAEMYAEDEEAHPEDYHKPS